MEILCLITDCWIKTRYVGIFNQAGRSGNWNCELGTGNPVSHPSVHSYLKTIQEEQAQARVRPKKAMPLFMDKLEKMTMYIVAQLEKVGNAPIAHYILIRDLFFSVSIYFLFIFVRPGGRFGLYTFSGGAVFPR